jgi:hypothetical protein
MKEEEVFQKAGLTEDEIVVVRARQRHYNTHMQQLHRLKELSGIPSFSRTDDEEVEYRKLNKLRTATLATNSIPVSNTHSQFDVTTTNSVYYDTAINRAATT